MKNKKIKLAPGMALATLKKLFSIEEIQELYEGTKVGTIDIEITDICNYQCVYCSPKNSLIWMADGYFKPIQDIKKGDCVFGFKKNNKKYGRRYFVKSEVLNTFTRKTDVIEMTLSNNEKIYSTPDHYWFTGRKEEKYEYQQPREKLQVIKCLVPFQKNKKYNKNYKFGYLEGIIDGDGTRTIQTDTRNNKNYKCKRIRISSKDNEIIERCQTFLEDFKICPKKVYEKNIIHLNLCGNKIWKIFSITKEIANIDFYKGWLAGIYDAEGNTDGNSIRISQYKKINPKVYKKIEKYLSFLNFKFHQNEKGFTLRGNFNEKIRFYSILQPILYRKIKPLILNHNIPQKQKVYIKSIKKLKKQHVFSLETESHNYINQGYYSRNCYGSYSPKGNLTTCKKEKLTTPEIKNIIDQAYDLDIRLLNIQGGEPMIDKKKFYEIIKYAKPKFKSIVAFTNGYFIEEEDAKILSDLNISLCVKLDSLDEKIYKQLTNSTGNVKKVLKGLDYLEKYKVTVTTNAVATPLNYYDIPNVWRYSTKKGFTPFVARNHYHGSTRENPTYQLTAKELGNLFKELQKIDKEEFNIEWDADIIFPRDSSCQRYRAGVFVNHKGVVIPCSEADPKHFNLGNIRKESLKNILSYKRLKPYRKIYDKLHGACSPKNCKYSKKRQCYGCRVSAADIGVFRKKEFKKEFFGGDALCPVNKINPLTINELKRKELKGFK